MSFPEKLPGVCGLLFSCFWSDDRPERAPVFPDHILKKIREDFSLSGILIAGLMDLLSSEIFSG
jgi:hypothetical protein